MQYYNEKLRDLRKDRDLTQAFVAKMLKMKQQQYSNYERGIRQIPIEKLRELCIYYNVSADYILDLPPMPYPKR